MPDFFAEFLAEIDALRMTTEGAALLATLYPIGILAALIEVRSITRSPRVRLGKDPRKGGFGFYSRASAGAIAVLALPAFVSMGPLANSVATGVQLSGWGVALASMGGWLLMAGLAVLVIEFVWAAFKADVEGPEGERSPTAPSAGPTSSGSRPPRPGTARRKPKPKRRG